MIEVGGKICEAAAHRRYDQLAGDASPILLLQPIDQRLDTRWVGAHSALRLQCLLRRVEKAIDDILHRMFSICSLVVVYRPVRQLQAQPQNRGR